MQDTHRPHPYLYPIVNPHNTIVNITFKPHIAKYVILCFHGIYHIRKNAISEIFAMVCKMISIYNVFTCFYTVYSILPYLWPRLYRYTLYRVSLICPIYRQNAKIDILRVLLFAHVHMRECEICDFLFFDKMSISSFWHRGHHFHEITPKWQKTRVFRPQNDRFWPSGTPPGGLGTSPDPSSGSLPKYPA